MYNKILYVLILLPNGIGIKLRDDSYFEYNIWNDISHFRLG